MPKLILTPEKAEKVQDDIYRKMPADKKIKIAGELFLLGKKLTGLKKQKKNEAGRTAL